MDDSTSSTLNLLPQPNYFRPEDAGFTHEQLLAAAFGGQWVLAGVSGFGPDGSGGVLCFSNGKGRLATFSLNTQLGELAWRAGVEGDAAPASMYLTPLRAALGEILQQAAQITEFNWQEQLAKIAQIADQALLHTADLTA